MNATKKFIGLSGSLKNVLSKREFARTLWIMSKGPEVAAPTKLHSIGCNCGCGVKHMHSKGKLDLINKNCDEIT